jgi:hypothetical protein
VAEILDEDVTLRFNEPFMLLHRLSILFAVLAFGVAITIAPLAARADTFDLKTLDFEKGRTYLEVNTSYFRGFPVNSERLHGSIDPTANYAITDRWLAAIKATTNKPFDEDFRVSTVGMEHTFALRKLEGGYAIGLYGGINAATHRAETNDFAFGPIVTVGTETTSLTLNPALDKTFGQNRVEGIAFTYGWQAKHELQKGFAVGIEGYGTIQNVGTAPTLNEQPHRIGPVLYLERELSRGMAGSAAMKGLSIKDAKSSASAADATAPPKLYMEAGVLFGLTEGTQDMVFKLKGGVEF